MRGGLNSETSSFDGRSCDKITRVQSSGVFRISKRGGPNFRFSLATSAHTKGGAKPSFPIFLVRQKNFFLAKGGPWHNGPPKYASGAKQSGEQESQLDAIIRATVDKSFNPESVFYEIE